jgi:hypothetical protein
LRPDTAAEAVKAISNFKSQFSEYKEFDSEILAFAENFAEEYMTFEAGSELDYQNRLKKYAVNAVAEQAGTRFASGSIHKK